MLINYLKCALRQLIRNKKITVINIMGLAVAFVSCLVMAGYAIHELSFDKMHENHERIYRISSEFYAHATQNKRPVTAAPLGPLVQANIPEIQKVTSFRVVQNPEIHLGKERLHEPRIFFADPQFLEVFTIPLLQGNPQYVLQAPNSLIIDKGLAQKVFHSSNPIGQNIRIRIGEIPYDFNVTGVMENMPSNTTLETSLIASFFPEHIKSGIDWNSNVLTYILLRKDADPIEVEKKIKGLYQTTTLRKWKLAPFLQALGDIYFDATRLSILGDLKNTADPALIRLLLIVGGLLFLMAAINYVNLSTAQILNRFKEVAVRKICGAEQRKLFSQFLVESTLSTSLAMAFGIMFFDIFKAQLESFLGRELAIGITSNLWILLIIAALIGTVGVLGGSCPAFYFSRFKATTLLRPDSGQKTGKAILRKTLVTFQYTITIGMIGFILVIAKQIRFMESADLGYKKDDMMVLRVNDSKKVALLYNEIKKIQGVQAATRLRLFLAGQQRLGGSIKFEGIAEDQEQFIQKVRADAEFIPTFGITLKEGRNFQANRPSDERTVLLNETAVKKYQIMNPIGKQVFLDGEPFEVIGVVKDFHTASLHSLIDPIIICNNESKDWYNYIALRVDNQRLALIIIQVQEAWKSILPGVPFQYDFSDDLIRKDYQVDKHLFVFLLSLCGLIVLVACLGVYGLAAYNAEKRTKEVGIRKVLGASIESIVVLLSRDSMLWVIIANIFAWPLIWFSANSFLQGFSYRTSISLMEFTFAGGISFVIALFAASIHAVRTALTDPVNTLKYE